MRTARAATRLRRAAGLVEKGNPNALSDAGSAALLLEAAAMSALERRDQPARDFQRRFRRGDAAGSCRDPGRDGRTAFPDLAEVEKRV
jgi:hypothetical protein